MKLKQVLMVPTGLEPATFRLLAECSNQLSYRTCCETLFFFVSSFLPFSLFSNLYIYVINCLYFYADTFIIQVYYTSVLWLSLISYFYLQRLRKE